MRLIASAISSLFMIFIFKVWLFSLGIPGFDTMLLFTPLQCYSFCTVGVVNAFNLIDGLNGLSSYGNFDSNIAFNHCFSSFRRSNYNFLTLLVSAILGFMIPNFPW